MSNNKQEQKPKIQTTFEISNVGPHINFKQSLDSSSLKLGIYANNGEGKTFISRLFRLLNKSDLTPSDSNNLLTFSKKSGCFKFDIKDQSNSITELKIDIERDKTPVIHNATKYIFHTFNSDYVKENIEAQGYRPDGNIQGYIISKERIDLTAEKDRLKEYEVRQDSLSKKLEEAIAKAQNDVLPYVSRNLGDFSAINRDNLLDQEYKVEVLESFEQNIKQFDLLKRMPTNLADIKELGISIDSKILEDVSKFLATIYTKSTLAEDFIRKVTYKHRFIELGTKYFKEEDEKLCPFCEQSIIGNAKALILQYQSYLDNIEGKVVEMAGKLEEGINGLRGNILSLVTEFNRINNKFNEYKEFIPECKNTSLELIVTSNEEDDIFSGLQKLILSKKGDISVIIETDQYYGLINKIKGWISNATLISNNNNLAIIKLNSLKNNIDNVRRQLTREICKSKFTELKDESRQIIEEFYKTRIDKGAIENVIREKESVMRKDKKPLITKLFKDLLHTFFGDDKYELDENTYCLKLQNQLLENNASKVLSEGEKGIISFCYFLAETYKFVSSEQEISNLFFIIDDPISSLDFHYVYVVSQILREINFIFNIERSRYIILSHNIEFISILIRNNIVSNKWILSKGRLEELKDRLIMPYEAHLRDIYDIAKRGKIADHTTPNSIRHILETLNQFISPDMEFNTFCNEKLEGFEKNSYIYTLIHDNSHGGVRVNKSYTEEMLKNGCVFVIEFLEKKFSGQINFIGRKN